MLVPTPLLLRLASVLVLLPAGIPPLPLSNAEFGPGSESMPIWLDDVMCQGGERSLIDCPHPPFGINDCGHEQDAGVDCSSPPTTAPPTTAPPTTTAESSTEVLVTTQALAPDEGMQVQLSSMHYISIERFS